MPEVGATDGGLVVSHRSGDEGLEGLFGVHPLDFGVYDDPAEGDDDDAVGGGFDGWELDVFGGFRLGRLGGEHDGVAFRGGVVVPGSGR